MLCSTIPAELQVSEFDTVKKKFKLQMEKTKLLLTQSQNTKMLQWFTDKQKGCLCGKIDEMKKNVCQLIKYKKMMDFQIVFTFSE
jgi:hypothetical protein